MRVISGIARGTKLNSIESLDTRPTLDRVKEALFSKIGSYLQDANVLDLFAGSGALGIEALSRGAKHCTFCEKSYEASKMLKQNIVKTKFEDDSTVLVEDYKKAIKKIEKDKFDIIFIDPPYKMDIAVKAIEEIIENNMLEREGIIILETDEEERDLKQIETVDQLEVYDVKKYGRVKLIFLHERG